MARLRRSDLSRPGFLRKRRGSGFTYQDTDGHTITDSATRERIKQLVIPPAWNDVWISPFPNGHIQATGVDARGRRQYRYHDAWRTRRDQEKFDHMIRFGEALPLLRETLALELAGNHLTQSRVLACSVRLLDLGFFRIGSEQYAEENHTYGLATMQTRHVTLHPHESTLTFDYTAKHAKRRVQNIVDPEVFDVVKQLKQRKVGGKRLLAYKTDAKWHAVSSAAINEYVKSLTAQEFTAKDFRTWNATVLTSVGLAVSWNVADLGPTRRNRAVNRVIAEVSDYLGNTPAVARKSYIDPRVIDRFKSGDTIREDLDRIGVDTPPGHPATQGAIEAAVLKLLR